MKIVKNILILVAVLIILHLVLTGINILENGVGGYDGRSMERILKKSPEAATVEDIEALPKSEISQLFLAAPAPDFKSMRGEYRAKLIHIGTQAFMNEFYAHHMMGPGHWEAKAFIPTGSKSGWGYNVFTVGEGYNAATVRTMKMDTFIGPSRFDMNESFHLVYAAYNEGLNHSMRDEIRKINDRLYLGVGCLAWNFDIANPAFFLLYGKPDKWVGPDS
ncbi:MAG: hypothetical protein JXO48_07200 [Deltaproteobacteria bacterium]|nr:hypothetical protein [Deltaproteobacteria bacterium]